MVECIAIPLTIIEIIGWVMLIISLSYLSVNFRKDIDINYWLSCFGIAIGLVIGFIASDMNGRFVFIGEFIKTLPCIVWVK